jgi:CBS domain-containing protein
MKVRDLMNRSAVCCKAGTNVGSAVQLMWENDCGILPVTDDSGKLTGVVTDRDICIAMGTRNRMPGDITVGEIATNKVHSCKPEDDIHEALHTMGEKQIRRLPVVDQQGVPQGVLSMDDMIAHGDLDKWKGTCELSSEEIIRGLKRLYRKKFPSLKKLAAAA